jgi:hypothetical protein
MQDESGPHCERVPSRESKIQVPVDFFFPCCILTALKYRDIDFDLECDKSRCLNGLDPDGPTFTPSDAQRLTQIFDNPQFIVDGAGANDIIQGGIADCWFLSALSTLSTAEGLLEKSCVAVSRPPYFTPFLSC